LAYVIRVSMYYYNYDIDVLLYVYIIVLALHDCSITIISHCCSCGVL